MPPPFDLVQPSQKPSNESPLFTPRVLSGIEATGRMHLGNYFGAVKQHIDLQHEYPGETYWVLADYHALANLQDRRRLREDSWNLVLDYLALGVDPLKATFYRQSDVPQTCELLWLISCILPERELTQIRRYQEAALEDGAVSAAIKMYPALMAADILGVRSTIVPIGADQAEHIEIARVCAQGFNATFGCNVFPVPASRMNAAANVPGLDGMKMGRLNGNLLPMFATDEDIRRFVLGSLQAIPRQHSEGPSPDPPLLQWFQWVAGSEVAAAWRSVIKEPKGQRWAAEEFCKELITMLEPFRERRQALAKDFDMLEDTLREGASRAREEVADTVAIVREKVGLGAYRRLAVS